MLSRFPWRPALSELIGGRRGGVRCNPSRSPLRARAQSFHTTLSESQTYVHEAKKSRFVAVASPVSSAEEAMVRTSSPFSSRTNASNHLLPSPALTDLCCFPYDCSSSSWRTCKEFVRDLGDSQASHNCFAYKAGPAQRCSDDGEPSGSAGIPILSAIEQESLDYVVCLVIRYYGGTKLGKGGLARAYGAAARECLKAAERIQVRPKARCEATIGFDDIGGAPVHQTNMHDPPLQGRGRDASCSDQLYLLSPSLSRLCPPLLLFLVRYNNNSRVWDARFQVVRRGDQVPGGPLCGRGGGGDGRGGRGGGERAGRGPEARDQRQGGSPQTRKRRRRRAVRTFATARCHHNSITKHRYTSSRD